MIPKEEIKRTTIDHEVEESSSVHNIDTERNDVLILCKHLDPIGFFKGFGYIWRQWTSRSDIGVNGYSWIFKLGLWCLTYREHSILHTLPFFLF